RHKVIAVLDVHLGVLVEKARQTAHGANQLDFLAVKGRFDTISLEDVSMDFGDEDKIIDSILEKLNFDNTYSLMLIDEKEQEEIVRSILEENEIPYLERFEKENCDSDVNNFKTGDFVYFLKLEREKVDKTIVITTSDKNDNFDYISPNIKTVYDEKLCEGFMISYGREVIDYSVHYSDLVG
ncbi:MAG: hypothetical protein MJ113_02570, partial [Lachnospiraceae bacterium]|nr:hypothetical protein [Lachnospiraceae bacterium]